MLRCSVESQYWCECAESGAPTASKVFTCSGSTRTRNPSLNTPDLNAVAWQALNLGVGVHHAESSAARRMG